MALRPRVTTRAHGLGHWPHGPAQLPPPSDDQWPRRRRIESLLGEQEPPRNPSLKARTDARNYYNRCRDPQPRPYAEGWGICHRRPQPRCAPPNPTRRTVTRAAFVHDGAART
eukprot:381648-Pyramimonas_sp.AAC.1